MLPDAANGCLAINVPKVHLIRLISHKYRIKKTGKKYTLKTPPGRLLGGCGENSVFPLDILIMDTLFSI